MKCSLQILKSGRIKPITEFLLKFLGLMFLWLNYESIWLKLFDEYILPFFSISVYPLSITITILLIILFLYCYIKFYKNKYVFDDNILLCLVFIFIVYIRYRITGYYAFQYIISSITYADILGGVISLFIIGDVINKYRIWKLQGYKKEIKSEFLLDHPIKSKTEDLLDYNKTALKIAEMIFKISANKAISIGILAPWGNGKTSLLNLISEEINDKAIIVKFNPRNSKSVNKIQEDFFIELINSLKQYHSNIYAILNEYMDALKLVDSNASVLKLLFRTKHYDRGLLKAQLSSIIKDLPKKLVVIIDDLDRLFSEEIMEVFKLIDSNASFPNTIFLTAYDKDYLNKSLGKNIQYHTEDFANKFFNIEIPIPICPYDKLLLYLRTEILNRINSSKEDIEHYNSFFRTHIEIIKKYLPTLRDIKRFIDLFITNYSQVMEELNFRDCFLLTIIKYRDSYFITKIYKKEFIEVKTKAVASSTFNQYYYAYNPSKNNEEHKYEDILGILFQDRNQYGSINEIKFFERYFVNINNQYIPLKTITEILNGEQQSLIKQIESWYEDNKLDDFVYYLEEHIPNNRDTKEYFINYSTAIYIISYYEPERLQFFISIVMRKNYGNIVGHTEYKNKIIDLFKLNYNNYGYNYKIIRNILIDILENTNIGETLILSSSEILSICIENLEQDIKNRNTLDETTMELFYSCIEKIDEQTHKITLSRESCDIIKRLIYEQPEYYINHFVRLGLMSSDPQYNTITCEPFWRQIFGTAETLKTFISLTSNNSFVKIKCVRNFWELYERNDYAQIPFNNQGNVKDMIDSDLAYPMNLLNELNTCVEELSKIISQSGSNDYVIKKLEDVKVNVEGIPLEIKLKNNLLETINTQLTGIKLRG